MPEALVGMLSDEDAVETATRIGVPKIMARLSIFRILLRHEKYAKAMSDLLLTLLAGDHLAHRHREILIMRIGWITGSVYEWTEHWRIAQLFGVDPQELLAVRDWRSHEGFDRQDRTLLAAVDEVVVDGALSDETRIALAEGFDEMTLLELLGAIGTWWMISVVLKGLAVPLDAGDTPWPPDGKVPPTG